MTSQAQFTVETFAAEGDYVEPRFATFATLAEARAEVRRRLGVARLTAARAGGTGTGEDIEPVECWTDRTAGEMANVNRGCGGVMIYAA